MEGYQVSAQCMALVRDNCLLPTKDAPELGYVRESTDKQYVPDVFYKVSDEKINKINLLELLVAFFSFIIFFISLIQLHYIGGFVILKRNETSCYGQLRVFFLGRKVFRVRFRSENFYIKRNSFLTRHQFTFSFGKVFDNRM